MTIAEELNEIAVAHGGTESGGGIAGAIDALNDALAGSDQQQAGTIEGAVRLLGEHISAGGGGTAIVVNDVEGTLDKTWKEIYDAVNGGSIVVVKADLGDGGYAALLVTGATSSEGEYMVLAATDSYRADSENSYPNIM